MMVETRDAGRSSTPDDTIRMSVPARLATSSSVDCPTMVALWPMAVATASHSTSMSWPGIWALALDDGDVAYGEGRRDGAGRGDGRRGR